MQSAELSVAWGGLLSRIFRRPPEEGRGFVVAFAAAHPRAGVSLITRALAAGLDGGGNRVTMLLDGRCAEAQMTSAGAAVRVPEGNAFHRLGPGAQADGSGEDWHSKQSSLAMDLEKLRQEYRYILVDCPSMRQPQHVLVLSPLVDGVVLVVEANRTQKHQLFYAERTISNAGGRILGHVLNKRTYAIPGWLHGRLEAFGV